ncbi:MAG: ATP phosphoribosyltransferase [Alphaproteobacteria bacterium]|nr:ATP phosphoribosyltransferase [Alphaproteobacteria bacterium]
MTKSKTVSAVGGPLVVALPSKGRLQEPALAFLKDCGLRVSAASTRDYRASIAGLKDVQVLYLSASEIPEHIIRGDVHLGLTGEDVLAEALGALNEDQPARRPITAFRLAFGGARLVVAVPAAWLDVATMTDLGEVARGFYRAHGRRLRVATKYERLTRAFFARAGLSDYLIVPSAGATEAAPAAGLADLIVDITTTGATLASNHLKVIGDGQILASQAGLFVSRAPCVPWSATAIAGLREILDRVDARLAAAGLSIIEAAIPSATGREPSKAVLAALNTRLVSLGCTGIEAFPRAVAMASGDALTMMKLRAECPDAAIYAVARALSEVGAREVRVQNLDYVFRPDDTTFARIAETLTLKA